MSSYKRNRSGNFTTEEIELLLSLVDENKALVDSTKQEDKKKGWELIQDAFNANCTIQREVPVLRMKLKNLKAQKRRLRTDDGEDVATADDDSDQDESVTSKKGSRKRTKIFTSQETQLLQELFDEHIGTSLDASLSRDSMDAKNKAWGLITEEFNKAQVSEVPREIQELKIKFKNMKAFRTNQLCKSDGGAESVEEAVVHIIPESSTVRKLRPVSQPTAQSIKIISNTSLPAKSRVYDIVMESEEPEYEFLEESDPDYELPLIPKANCEDDKEMEKIRKENLLLKNSVLRKKERLLELQISIAERNLRRHQL